jgi:outer membrane protein W
VAWLTEIDIDFEEAGGEVSYSGDGVGLRALFGARYELGERFFLDAGVRYTAVSSVELDAEEVAIGRIEADYEPWSVPVGFGWRF